MENHFYHIRELPLNITIFIMHLCKCYVLFVFFCFTSQVNSYGHGRTVSSPNNTFFIGKLEQAVNQYFVHILSLVTDSNLAEGRRMTVEIIGTGPGSNSLTLDLQSDSHLLPDTLPTALRGPVPA